MRKYFSHWQTEIDVEEDIDLLLQSNEEHKLIVHNDDFNTFDWVIETLVTVCKHTTVQAEQCAYIVHYNGKCQVKRGSKESIDRMHRALVLRGLTATVE